MSSQGRRRTDLADTDAETLRQAARILRMRSRRLAFGMRAVIRVLENSARRIDSAAQGHQR